MGSKMDKVRCNGKESIINEYGPDKTFGRLKYCCNADVSFVNSYGKGSGERKTIVQSYFRLKNGQEHEKECRYIVDGVVFNLFALCADHEAMPEQNNKYVKRWMLSPRKQIIKRILLFMRNPDMKEEV